MFHLPNLGEIVKAFRTFYTNAGDTIHGIPDRAESWRREMGHPKFLRTFVAEGAEKGGCGKLGS